MPTAALNRLMLITTASAALSACSPATLLNVLAPSSTYDLATGLPYGHSTRQALDVYIPTTRTPRSEPMPVVVFFYGGSWQSGERDEYRFVGEALASRGMIVVIPDYRKYPEVVFPAFMDDAARAVRWARDHAQAYGGDKHRLILMGHSAGAQIVALLATDRRYLNTYRVGQQEIAAVVALAGPYDFLPLRSKVLERIFPITVRDDSQPIRFVTGREPPMWLGVGNSDSLVDPGNTERFADRLSEMGDNVHVQRYDLGHLLLLGALGLPIRKFSTVLDDIAAYVDSVPASASDDPGGS
ncbi:alpha/beta hydrolase [Pandoraea sputorum]|uniref:Lipase 2 n=1 Tax=Pandoraea sputorum TaxID=93222 RepID=A0A239SAL3_9BURK|nr:alpha/beta hydrolase [Pandoraea sputorum]AJC16206.1 carboxylesterase [Pandoraea sputorum]SNU82450.1 Lipase 2 [Pandoraea sputorum]VVE47600.1 carboxylesterase [Pandoraea sputorum]